MDFFFFVFVLRFEPRLVTNSLCRFASACDLPAFDLPSARIECALILTEMDFFGENFESFMFRYEI